MAINRDPMTYTKAVVFNGSVAFAETPAEIVLTNLTALAIGADGLGTAAPALSLKKTAAGTADVNFLAADDLRGRIRLNGDEGIVIETFDAAEDSTGTITMSNAAGAVALSGALAVTGATTLAATACTTLAASGTATMAAINASGTVAAAGAVTVGTTLGVTGATTAAAVACTTLAASGAVTCATTLGVTGTSTLAAVACTTLAPSGDITAAAAVTVGTTLGVTGATTLAAAACTTLAASGAVTCATTLGVTGASTLAAVACTTLAPSGDITAAAAVTVGTTLGVTGTATMAAINASGTIAAAGAVTVGTTLGVTGTSTVAAVTASGTITTNGALDVNGNLDLAGATVVAPFVVPEWYISQEIAFSDLGAGATDAIALTGLPVGSWHVLAVHVETGAETTSSDGGTTGLAIEVGHTGGNVDALVESISIFGAASEKVAPRGVEVGGLVDLTDAIEVLFTATGGGADLDHINAMRLHVALLLAPAPTITFA